MAAGWSSPHTFVRFYNLDVNTAPGSQVLSGEPTVCLMFWSVMGQIWQRDSLACVVYRSHCSKLRSVELPMKENVSVYLRNPCSLSRETRRCVRCPAPLAVDMLLRQENRRGKMAQTRVYVKHVEVGAVSHAHQPMNWCDFIWASDNRSHLGVPTAVSYAASRSLH